MLFKRILAAVLVVSTVLTIPAVSAVGAEGDITILVNNQEVQAENKPVIIEGTTFVPLRPAAEAMGCIVEWNDETKTANISMGDKIIALQIGNTKISKYEWEDTNPGQYLSDRIPVFSEEIVCNMPPRIINNSTYIPLRAMAEALDAEVDWDANSKTVSISTNSGETTENNVIYKVENNNTLVFKGTGSIIGNFGPLNEKSSYDYSGIEYLIIEEGITLINAYSFASTNIKSVSLPDSLISINNGAFYYCLNLTSITIPENVNIIYDRAFKECSSLTSVVILSNNISGIDASVFYGCTSLTDINLPDSVTYIGSSAFEGCSSLKEMVLPSSVTSIKQYAFSGCTSLEEITIPESTEIDSTAFSGCYNLKTVICKEGSAADNADLYPSDVTFIYQ